MTVTSRPAIQTLLVLGIAFAAPAWAQAPAVTHARGSFDVTLTPQSPADSAAGLGRMSIVKRFHGDLDGTSLGEMLAAMTKTSGSAGYVAIERVSGTLHGRRGTFLLQHHGLMARGAPQLTITVIPDSGTDDLTGLAGTMLITITGDEHAYDFSYTITSAP